MINRRGQGDPGQLKILRRSIFDGDHSSTNPWSVHLHWCTADAAVHFQDGQLSRVHASRWVTSGRLGPQICKPLSPCITFTPKHAAMAMGFSISFAWTPRVSRNMDVQHAELALFHTWCLQASCIYQRGGEANCYHLLALPAPIVD